MLTQEQLRRIRLPVGELTKHQVREIAADLGLRTAHKPDSQDVCFISRSGGRQEFLGARIELRPGRIVDPSGVVVGQVPAVELVTVGQRRGLGALTSLDPGHDAAGPDDGRRYVVDVDIPAATVTVGPLAVTLVTRIDVRDPVWVDGAPAPGEDLDVQMSAHGRPVPARWAGKGTVGKGTVGKGTVGKGTVGEGTVEVLTPVRRVAPGQSVVLYRADAVIGGGQAA
jgi:tRNA-specific 2-thiouridylase